MAKISPDDWKAVFALLDTVLDLSGDERRRWIESLERTHSHLKPEVRELLARHASSETGEIVKRDFLEALPEFTEVNLGIAADALPQARAGDLVGAYRLLSILGRGGMGEVWLAERADGRFEGQCAIKFLDAASTSPKLVERFRHEGRVLARLTHQNIARLIDAGATASGRPYLALEYVAGERIDAYCDRKKLSIDERIRLFVEVVAAVAHAHTQLVIHRDLKPSNVLVTQDGVVKLLDFGIAKLLAEDEREATQTRLEDVALTPEYAAPEQLLGESPSTATDIYQLGLLLYVLLAGRHPLPRDGKRADRIRAALDRDLPRASDLADPQRRKMLRGDLDAILGIALRKSPQERFATAQAFSDELLRYLRHEPVLSRRGEAWYRVRKFAIRHRLLAAASVVAVIGIVTAFIVINRERVIAERRFDQLRQLATRVLDLDNKIQSLAGSTEARQRLVSVTVEYLQGLESDARGDLELSATLANAFWRVAAIQGVPNRLNLGDFESAERNLVKAQAFAEAVLASNPKRLDMVLLTALIAQDRMIIAESERRRVDALAHAKRATERAESSLSMGGLNESEHDAIATLFANVALAYLNMDMYPESVASVRRELELAKIGKPKPDRICTGLSMLANGLRLQGDLEGALKAISEARALAEQTPYDDVTYRMSDLYGIYLREGFILGEDGGVSLNRPVEAMAAFQRAYDIVDAGVRRDPKDVMSRSRAGNAGMQLANVLRHTDPNRALAIYDLAISRLVEIQKNLRARREQAMALANSSYALRSLQRVADARHRVESAMAVLVETKDLPAKQVDFNSAAFVVLLAQADLQAEIGQRAEARDSFAELLNLLATAKPDPRVDLRAATKLSAVYGSFESLLRRTGEHASAERVAGQRMDLWKQWERKLPSNGFVLRQLEAASTRVATR